MTLSITGRPGGASHPPRRLGAKCTPQWQAFQTEIRVNKSERLRDDDATTHVYMRQYSHVYRSRLTLLGPLCREGVETKYPKEKIMNRVLDLTANAKDTRVVVIGTLIKEPVGMSSTTTGSIFEDSDTKKMDTIVLEDSSGRVPLDLSQSNLKVGSYCTGVVAAVLGKVIEGGSLSVEEIIPPKPLEEPKALPLPTEGTRTADQPHVMFLSGLHCGSATVVSLTRDLLLAYLEGSLTLSARKVTRVIIAGGSIAPDASNLTYAVKEMDAFLSLILSAGIPVHILPGETDPTSLHWPQRPLHSSLFRTSASFPSLLNRTPNPYASAMQIDDDGASVTMWGTDGRNVGDLKSKQGLVASSGEPLTECQILKQLLEWRHMCPTGPESVPTVPHAQLDPMVMKKELAPHVWFAGNASKFGTEMVGGKTRVVAIPKFSETGQACLLNLATLDVELVRFVDQP